MPTISPRFAAKLMGRLGETLPDCGRDERERRVQGALEFLHCCARPGAPSLAPSPAIDEVWHEMIIFTADYRELCHSMDVAFIDHEPLDGTEPNAPTVAATVTFMKRCGLDPSPDLWDSTATPRCCSGHISF
jgi:hypothetical protein